MRKCNLKWSMSLARAAIVGVAIVKPGGEAVAAPQTLSSWANCRTVDPRNRGDIEHVLQQADGVVEILYTCDRDSCDISFRSGQNEIFTTRSNNEEMPYICETHREREVEDRGEECRGKISVINMFFGYGDSRPTHSVNIVARRSGPFDARECFGAEIPQFPLTGKDDYDPEIKVYFRNGGRITVTKFSD